MSAERFIIDKMDCYSPIEWRIIDTKYGIDSNPQILRKRKARQMIIELLQSEDKRDMYGYIFGRCEEFYKEFY